MVYSDLALKITMDMLHFVSWYLAICIAGLLALPITFRLFRHLPDRGYSFSKPLSLLFGGYIFWFFGSLGFLNNDLSGPLTAFLALGILGVIWLKRDGLEELRVWFVKQRTTILLTELLFLAAFTGWTVVRAYNPDILGTEKPMEFMFLNSILHSPTFPPQDSWLSNHAISYYYFGYVLIAMLARITATPSAVAFNLGLALLFGLVTSGAHGLVMNMIALVKRRQATAQKEGFSLRSAFWPALLGPLMVLIVGNFYGVLELAHDNGMFANTAIPAVWYNFGNAIDLNNIHGLADFERPPGVRVGWVNLWEWLDLKQLRPEAPATNDRFQWNLANWFFASRVVHDRNLTGVETEAIDEFPAFSFLLGDMHPHVLALPFVVLAIALSFEWLLGGMETSIEELDHIWKVLKNTAGRFLLSGVVLGALFFLNTWDFPIYWFLTTICFVFGISLTHGMKVLVQHWRGITGLAFSLLITCLAFYWPFLITFQSQAGGILPNLIYPTRFQQSLVMFGPLLVGVIPFLIWLLVRRRHTFHWRAAGWSAAGILLSLVFAAIVLGLVAILNPGTMDNVAHFLSPLDWRSAFHLLWQRRLVDSMTAISAALLMGVAIGLGLGFIHQDGERQGSSAVPVESTGLRGKSTAPVGIPAIALALAMILTASLLWIGPEFVYLRDNFGTRMNTLFKFYFQVWVLLGLSAAFGIWYFAHYTQVWTRRIVVGVVTVSMVFGSFYLVGGLRAKTNDFAGPPTLDGMAYFARSYPNDWAAIQWLEENASASSVILEGSQGAYWIEGRSSRFSMATGIPTVMGWANHENQWRGEYFAQVASRQEDIRTIYKSRDWSTVQELLDKYKIQYVIVSSLERDWYSPIDSAKFDRYMQRVFEQGDVVIYQR